jgi:peptidoglycan/xylan/chitin deacetylase (PgdA/CDA1 family)
MQSVVLTADDGTADWVDVLLPLLVERRIPMTWYVATKFVDGQEDFPYSGVPISWPALREAVSTGLVTVGSHTHSHAVMTRLGATDAARELDRSIGLIEDRLGQPCRHFAYPKALAPSVDADREVRKRFTTAALAGNRVNVPMRTDLARLGRTPIKRSDAAGRFMRKLHGGGRVEGWLRERYDEIRHHDAVT